MDAHVTSDPFVALRTMLAAHPEAWVGAINRNARYVPTPDTLPVTGHRPLRGTWALDHVVHADRVKLAAAWRRRAAGVGSAEVRMITGGVATYHVFGLMDAAGVDVVVAIPDDEADLAAVAAVAPVQMASRFCRIKRDENGRTIELDRAATSVLRYSAAELLSDTPALERVHPDDQSTMLACWLATLTNDSDGHRCRVRIRRGDGTIAWFEITNFNRLDDAAQPHVVSEMLDISEEMAAHDALAAREQLLHRLAEALPLGIVQVGLDRSIVYANDRLGAISGVHDATTLDEQLAGVGAGDRATLLAAFDAALVGGADDEVVVHTTDDRILRVTIKSLAGTGAVACVADVTDEALMGRELERRATYDDLTGCLNRSTILDRLDAALASRAVGSAVIFVDLDDFKGVNDRCGHAVGDEVLKLAATTIDRATRAGDDVGRIGGDEFLVVCRDVVDPDEAMRLAQRIGESLATERVAGKIELPLRASIGVSWSAPGGATADELVERADAAMYVAKRSDAGVPVSA